MKRAATDELPDLNLSPPSPVPCCNEDCVVNGNNLRSLARAVTIWLMTEDSPTVDKLWKEFHHMSKDMSKILLVFEGIGLIASRDGLIILNMGIANLLFPFSKWSCSFCYVDPSLDVFSEDAESSMAVACGDYSSLETDSSDDIEPLFK